MHNYISCVSIVSTFTCMSLPFWYLWTYLKMKNIAERLENVLDDYEGFEEVIQKDFQTIRTTLGFRILIDTFGNRKYKQAYFFKDGEYFRGGNMIEWLHFFAGETKTNNLLNQLEMRGIKTNRP